MFKLYLYLKQKSLSQVGVQVLHEHGGQPVHVLAGLLLGIDQELPLYPGQLGQCVHAIQLDFVR